MQAIAGACECIANLLLNSYSVWPDESVMNFIVSLAVLYYIITFAHVGGGYNTLHVCLSGCLSVCLLTPISCLNSFILKSKQTASLKLDKLRQKVVLYKTDKLS